MKEWQNDMDRTATLVDLRARGQSRFARAQNFSVERVVAVPGNEQSLAADDEIILLCIDAEVRVTGSHEAEVGPRSIAILPPGVYQLGHLRVGRLFVLTTRRRDIAAEAAVNADHYRTPDGRVAAIGEPFERTRPGGITIFAVDAIKAPASNPRIKFLQSATMSINWVEYEGPRDRTALSPHSHQDFEQGSLAIEGGFVHHLRTPWASNADRWRDDEHMRADSDTLLIVPPEIIHTTEGAGDERHLLIDIFAPPRRDFIARDWVCNATDYVDPRHGSNATS